MCYLQDEKMWVVVLQNSYIFARNCRLHWIEGRTNILSNNLIYIFSNFGVAFTIFFLYSFQKLQLLVVNKFWNNFCCNILLFVWAQNKMSQIFNVLFETGSFNIFVLHGVVFSRSVQLKSSLSEEKNIIERLSKFNVVKY